MLLVNKYERCHFKIKLVPWLVCAFGDRKGACVVSNMLDPVLGVLIAVAIGQFSLSLTFAYGLPCQELFQTLNFDACFAKEDAEQQRRKRQCRFETFSSLLPWWILANDSFGILFIISDIFTYLQAENKHHLGFDSFFQISYGIIVIAFSMVLRFMCSCGSEESTVRDTILIFLSLTVTMHLAPPQWQPIGMLVRLILLEVVPEPGWYWRMQVTSIPVNVAVSWLKAFDATGTADWEQMKWILVAESVGSLGVVLSHCRSDWAFSQQMRATISAEACAEEANSMSSAARQLLSVTCDACACLSTDLHISKPSATLLGLLKVNEDLEEQNDMNQQDPPVKNGKTLKNIPFTDFVLAEDRERFRSIMDFSSTTPSSGLVHLVDADEAIFKARIFLVQCGSMGHLIGIAKEGHDFHDSHDSHDSLHSHDCHDSRCGDEVPFRPHEECAENWYHCASNWFRTPSLLEAVPEAQAHRSLDEVHEIEQITVVIDPLSVDLGFTVKSATFQFAEPSKGRQRRLPNLVEWLDPHWRNEVMNWVQEEVNLAFNGHSKGRPLEAVELFTPRGNMVADFRIECTAGSSGEFGDILQIQAEISIQNCRYFLQGPSPQSRTVTGS
eukprot:Skav205607  [mRNA]  locus=scaffold460:202124:203959:+ [translate_table: standard]